ncbi:MAG: hypothetical protein J6C93_06530 [Clostridia bacterium]|nr:hypothetical protein [Clostridia bacterium]
MKRPKIILLLAILFPVLTACDGDDFSSRISEARSDLFYAQTDEFSVTFSCVTREQPHLSDGIVGEKQSLVEISLRDFSSADGYRIFFSYGETEGGGETSFHTVKNEYYYEQSVKEFPTSTVDLRIECGEHVREITATSVKNENTLSIEGALEKMLEQRDEALIPFTEDGELHAEFYVRLLRREKNYYYVAIVGKNGNTHSFLLDGESGEILAEREHPSV